MNQARASCIEYGLAMRRLLEDLLDELACIEGRIKAVTGKVEAHASQHDAVGRLVTIPGTGAPGATAIVAAAGDGRQFRKARDLAAWLGLGLVPAEHSTGGKQTLLGISRRGNRYVPPARSRPLSQPSSATEAGT